VGALSSVPDLTRWCISDPVGSGATDAKVFGNVFSGAKQYGIIQSGSVTSKHIRDNSLAPGANYGALISGPAALYAITSINNAGLGVGVNGTPILSQLRTGHLVEHL
jgi:hypothetical protein